MAKSKNRRPLRVKLIFNPMSGNKAQSPGQLLEIVTQMQKQNIWPEVHILDPGSGFAPIIKGALQDGTQLLVASGGDHTADSLAAELAGTGLTMGILPTGTNNNLAINLQIPRNLEDAVALLRGGQPVKIDVGVAKSGNSKRHFLEVLTLGLLTDMFAPSEEIRRGNLLKAGEAIATFAASTPSLVTIEPDSKKPVSLAAYFVMVTNMPYIGRNFRLSKAVSFTDNKLDIFVFTELKKMGLINYAIRYVNGEINDETIRHFRVHRAKISTEPQMATNADGIPLPPGRVRVKVRPEAVQVMAGSDKGHGPRRRELPDLTKVEDE